jgi:signal transduction histidine kinase
VKASRRGRRRAEGGPADPSEPRRRSARGTRWTASIRIRVLAVALIPSVALLVTGASVAASLISGGLAARSFADVTAQSIGSWTQFQGALENERTISLRALGGDRHALAALPAQWNATNTAFTGAETASSAMARLKPQLAPGQQGDAAFFAQVLARLAAIRQGVQKRQASASAVDAFYSQLANLASGAFLLIARGAPTSGVAVDALTTLDLIPVIEEHSRTAGLEAGWAESGALTESERLEVAQLAGAYRNGLQELVTRLPASEQSTYGRVTAGSAWRLATSGEDALATRGELGVPMASWLAAENTVSADLLGLWSDNFREGENAALAAADQTLSRSVLVGSLVLVLAIAAFAAALVLANGVVRRLRRLRAKTLELADVTLPSIVRRIGDGELVDVDSEMTLLAYGTDEIGQVADAFNTAQRTAVVAAAAEARARGGINKVFLDIAHRSQLVVHRQLELLDVAEARQGDPEHLELLFQLDHLATRARRNAENLLVLGGGQAGRRWRHPAALEDVVRSAVSETEHYARVSTVRLPDVRVQGSAVGDLIHLLAELVDNATAFSPPDSTVTVNGNLVGKGVVVAVEDQGLGIEHAERERLNETLRHPPDFQVMALSGQRHLGLFVIGQLAQRHGITVTLLESAYGGTKAIVLIPAAAVDMADAGGEVPPPPVRRGRHEQPPGAPVRLARDLTPSLAGTGGPGPAGNGAPSMAGTAAPLPAGAPVRVAPWDIAAGPAPTRSGRAPLPRRERLANLAPGLRADAGQRPDHKPTAQSRRSPHEARGSMSAFQRGTRLGRDVAAKTTNEGGQPSDER